MRTAPSTRGEDDDQRTALVAASSGGVLAGAAPRLPARPLHPQVSQLRRDIGCRAGQLAWQTLRGEIRAALLNEQATDAPRN